METTTVESHSSAPTVNRKGRRVSDVENPALALPTNNGPLPYSKIDALREEHGSNKIVTEERIPSYMIFLQALLHPFNILLCIIAIISGVAEREEWFTPVIITAMIVMSTILRFYQEWKSESAVHSLLKLVKKTVTVIRFDDNVEMTANESTIPAEELVPGDWIVLHPGDVVPADAIVLTSKVFFVSEAPLTGEAIPIEKYPSDEEAHVKDLEWEMERRQSDEARQLRIERYKPMSKVERFCRWILGMKIKTHSHLDKKGFELKEHTTSPDHVWMGCQVITGVATARVLRIGRETLFGRMAEALAKEQSNNPFQQGVRRISWIFFITMALMVPPLLLTQGFLHNNWQESLLFSLSVAVGLTPEMLPVIVNANLAKGSLQMTKNKSVIRKTDAIINLGAVDVLCTDKTGTLTRSVVQLSAHNNPYGETSYIPLQLAFLNAYFQSVLQNPIDSAITMHFVKLAGPEDPRVLANKSSDDDTMEDVQDQLQAKDIDTFLKKFGRLDEIPFDFARRRLSVLLQDTRDEFNPKLYLICKGSAEETLAVCSSVMDPKSSISKLLADAFPQALKHILPLDKLFRERLLNECRGYSDQGKRVLAIALKPIPQEQTQVTTADETDMTFVGFVSFLDPPKETTKNAIQDLMKHNIEVKVLTGDSPNICSAVCKQIKLPVKAVITGEDIEHAIENGTISEVVEHGTIFAKLTPLQKSLVVQTLRMDNNHVVAFLGDGVNDAPAIKEADVGISVENGVDICRESADIILLDKDLNAVVTGIRIGRQTYGNTLKYIVMAVSSNFGNVFSTVCASAWLDFPAMEGLQLLVQNLLYDTSQLAIPWDNMDEEFLMVPHRWRMKSVLIFMAWMGPWSSVFDIATFLFMYFEMGVKSKQDEGTQGGIMLFQTEWFLVGLTTQVLIVHMIRTPKIPLFQSNASWALTVMTILIMGLGLTLPQIPKINTALKLTSNIPAKCYYFILAVLAAYCVAANVAKFIYIRVFKEWF